MNAGAARVWFERPVHPRFPMRRSTFTMVALFLGLGALYLAIRTDTTPPPAGAVPVRLVPTTVARPAPTTTTSAPASRPVPSTTVVATVPRVSSTVPHPVPTGASRTTTTTRPRTTTPPASGASSTTTVTTVP